MSLNIARETATLHRMTVPQLRRRYAEIHGETTNAANKAWLVKRILWRLQALAEGDLSERARRRAAELANDADLRLNPPARMKEAAESEADRTVIATLPGPSDTRLPPPGTVLTRPYKGRVVQVLVRDDGFEFEGTVHPSLSAAAKAVTGSHCNGYLFFKLNTKGTSA